MGSRLNGGKRKFYICEMKVLPNSTLIYIMCFLDCRFCPHVFKRFVDLFPVNVQSFYNSNSPNSTCLSMERSDDLLKM